MRRTRTELLRLLEPGLGHEAANALLEEIETVDPGRLATKDDIGEVRSDMGLLRGDVDGLRNDVDLLRSDIDGLRVDMGTLRVEMEARFTNVSTEITSAKNELLAAIRKEMIDSISNQTRTMQYTLGGTVAAVIAGAATLSAFV